MSRLASLRKRLAREAEVREAAAAVERRAQTPIPADIIEAYRYVIFPDQDTGRPIKPGMTQIQRGCITGDGHTAPASCWRHDADGNRIRGRDIYMKSRKVFATSLFMGLTAIEMCRTPNTHALLAMPQADESVARTLWRTMISVFRSFPSDWPQISSQTKDGFTIVLENGSSWTLVTAGSASLADAKGRGITYHIVQLSEAGFYSDFHSTWAATVNTMPARSWLVIECTPPPDRDHPFAREYRLTRDGVGQLHCSFFIPWYLDHTRRFSKGTTEYKRTMTDATAERIGGAELALETRLGLDNEQRAWRRWYFHFGSKKLRRKNRVEYPESDETCHLLADLESYLDETSLDQVDLMTRPPEVRHKIHSGWIAEIWDTSPEYCLITTDQATLKGRDRSSVVVIDPWDHHLIATVHGSTTAKNHFKAITWLLDTLGCRSKKRHLLSPERNKDEETRLIEDFIYPARRKLKLHWQSYADRKGKRTQATMPGHLITRNNRGAIIASIVAWVEGEGDPDDPETYGPQCDIPSAALASELRSLILSKGRVEAAPSHHDDLAIPWGVAMMLASSLKFRRPSESEKTVKTTTASEPVPTRGRDTYLGRRLPT